MSVFLGLAASASFAIVIWVLGVKRMTRTVLGFALWMAFTLLAILFMAVTLFPDEPLWLAPAAAVLIGPLTYALNYQIDDRAPR